MVLRAGSYHTGVTSGKTVVWTLPSEHVKVLVTLIVCKIKDEGHTAMVVAWVTVTILPWIGGALLTTCCADPASSAIAGSEAATETGGEEKVIGEDVVEGSAGVVKGSADIVTVSAEYALNDALVDPIVLEAAALVVDDIDAPADSMGPVIWK
jgi:acyl-CoA reductase-like NAD-dependent aldehyde dehydrogenase